MKQVDLMQRRSLFVPRRAVIFLILIAAMLVAGPGVGSPQPAAAKSVTWRNYDVTLTLNGDSTFHVAERQIISFEGGPFHFAYAGLSLAEVEDLTGIKVSEIRNGSTIAYQQNLSGDPETYSLEIGRAHV